VLVVYKLQTGLPRNQGLISSRDTRFSCSIHFSSGAHPASYATHTEHVERIWKFIKTGVSVFMDCVLNVTACNETWLWKYNIVIVISISAGTVSKGHPQAYLYQESMLVVLGISYKYFLPTGCTNNLLQFLCNYQISLCSISVTPCMLLYMASCWLL
jgi:hypothetical protein